MRTLTQLWPSLGVDERLHIFLERYRTECPALPTTLRSAGYADAIADLEHYVLNARMMPGEGFN